MESGGFKPTFFFLGLRKSSQPYDSYSESTFDRVGLVIGSGDEFIYSNLSFLYISFGSFLTLKPLLLFLNNLVYVKGDMSPIF